MSSPLDLASRTNSRAVYKECHRECSICQFDAYKFPYSWVSVLQPYLMVGQVADALRWCITQDSLAFRLQSMCPSGLCWQGNCLLTRGNSIATFSVNCTMMTPFGPIRSKFWRRSRLQITPRWRIQSFVIWWQWGFRIGIRRKVPSCIKPLGWCSFQPHLSVALYQGSWIWKPR